MRISAAIAFSLWLAACDPIEAQKPDPAVDASSTVTFPPPENQAALDQWQLNEENLFRYQVPGNSASPRFASLTTGPKYDVSTHAGAVAGMVKYTGIDFRGEVSLEPMEAWSKFDGRDLRVAIEPTNYGGGEGVAFVLISQTAGSDQFGVWALEMPRATFEAWGGASRMMILRQLLPSMEAVPANERQRIASAPLDQQLAFYEAGLDKLLEQLAGTMALQAEANTLMLMMDLNYDLLFGDQSLPTIHPGD